MTSIRDYVAAYSYRLDDGSRYVPRDPFETELIEDAIRGYVDKVDAASPDVQECPDCGMQFKYLPRQMPMLHIGINETERDWAVCCAVDAFRAPRNEGDERTLADFLADEGLWIAALAEAQEEH